MRFKLGEILLIMGRVAVLFCNHTFIIYTQISLTIKMTADIIKKPNNRLNETCCQPSDQLCKVALQISVNIANIVT